MRARTLKAKMWVWSNECEIPAELLGLLNVQDLPNELRQEIMQAQKEVDSYGAVAYPTKARVEYYMHKYADFIKNLPSEDRGVSSNEG